MSWWHEWADRIDPDAEIGAMTWYRIGGRARWLAHPQSDEELARMRQAALDAGCSFHVLGRGANVLVRDEGVDGVVVRLDAPRFMRVDVRGSRVCAGAGVDLMRLCKLCAKKGLAGIEGLAAIPATVGGAVRMNAGGRYGQFGDAVVRAEVLGADGTVREVDRAGVGFGYRSWGLGLSVVLGVELELTPDDPVRVWERFREYWRLKRATQPVGERSAGCVFKNPANDSAGRLIDLAGLKGESIGGARVSERHANFIVATGDAKAADVIRLAERVRERVRACFGRELEFEMEVW